MVTRTRTIGWILMTVLAAAVAAYAGTVLMVPGAQNPVVRGMFARSPVSAAGHLIGGSLAIVIGAFQANGRLRARHIRIHRRLGRVYVAAVVFSGVSAFVLAVRSFGGPVAHIGFGALAICWVGATVTAYLHMRRGDSTAHGEWMIRSYSLTLAAVTLRLYLPLAGMAGLPFENAYQAIAWMCWVPNLMLAEWFIARRRGKRRAVQPRAA